ncbi:hypothetical protein ACUNGU_08740 [Serratia sp. IR-2025]
MDKQQEESRKQFEKYFDDAYGCHPTDSHDPRHVEVIWHVWQASRASIVVDVPEKVMIEDEFDNGHNCAIDYCAESIRSIGLSIKGE